MSATPDVAPRRIGAVRAATGSAAPELGRETSDTIRAARVLCILFMMTVHVWPGTRRILDADSGPILDPLFAVVVGAIGLSSVPLLSYFSGLLFHRTLRARGAGLGVIGAKARTLLWPMVFWSIPMLAVIVAEDVIRTGSVSPEGGALYWAQMILGFGEGPANSPLHFFRDIFVMCVYVTGLVLLCRISRPLAAVAWLAVCAFELRMGMSLMARDHIFLFFTAGLAMGHLGRANWRPGPWLALLALAAYSGAAVSGALDASPGGHWGGLAISTGERLAVSLAMFVAAAWAAGRTNALRRALFWLEARIFTIFCSHMLTISVFGGLAFALGWSENDLWYPVIFAVQIAACVVVGIVLQPLLSWIPYVTGREAGPAGQRAPAARAGA